VDIKTMQRRATTEKRINFVHGWNRIMHRDLKPGNVFLTWKDGLGVDVCLYPTVILADFGCCVTDSDVHAGRAQGPAHHSGITPEFAPPETPAHTEASEVYGLGLGLVLHCLGRMRDVPDPTRTVRELFPLPVSLKITQIGVKQLLRREPNLRPIINDLPAEVWTEYTKWRRTRSDDGRKLPDWAF
jgi:serine/threonine protein kinase